MGFPKFLQTSILLFSILGLGTHAIAPLPANAVKFPRSSPSRGAPPRTASGAPQRNPSCIREYKDDKQTQKFTKMTVLAPSSNIITSLSKNPTLMVYLPKLTLDTNGDGQQDVFEPTIDIVIEEKVLVPNQGYQYREIYYESFAIEPTVFRTPRLAAYHLNNANLEPGKQYHWLLHINCSPVNLGQIEGEISCANGCTAMNTLPNAQSFTQQQLIQSAQDYADQFFWNETLNFTVQLRQSDPAQWEQLLESQGLECLTNVAFANDYRPESMASRDPACDFPDDTQAS